MELNRGAVFLFVEDYNENWNYARLVIKKGFKETVSKSSGKADNNY